jgi:hypothetical protein
VLVDVGNESVFFSSHSISETRTEQSVRLLGTWTSN